MRGPIASLALLVAALTAAAEEKPAPKFVDGKVRLLNTPGIAADISPDGQAGTVLFDSLQASVGGRGGSPVSTRTHTVSCGLTANAEPVKLKQYIRGFATATPNGTVTLVVQSGGKTTVVDLVKCKVDAIPEADARKWKKRDARGKLLGEGFEFLHACEVTIPADSTYQVTFLVLAERSGKDATEGGLVSVDSLDFEIQPPKR